MSDAKDSNGAVLEDGDSVQLVRDLKLKGKSMNLKRGTVFKNISTTNSPAEIECRHGKAILVLKAEFLKKI